MADGSRTLKLSILADVDSLKRGLTDAGDKTDSFGTKLGGFGKAAGLAFAAAGAAALAYAGTLLVDGVKSAIEDEAAQAKLATTLQNVTGATDAQIAATESYITQQGLSLGITDDELRPALERLVRATGDVTEAQKLASLAFDISAGTGKSLEAVSNALGKAVEGNTGALGKLGIGISAADLKAMSFEEITSKLAETFGGQATQKAETFAGKVDRLKLAFNEAKENVGSFVLDALTPLTTKFVDKVIPAVTKLSTQIGEKLQPIFKSLGTFLTESIIPVLTDLWNYISVNVVPVFITLAGFINDVWIPALKAAWAFIGDYLVPILKSILTPVLEGLNTVFKKLTKFIEDNNAVFTFLGAVISVIGGAAKLLAPIIGTTLGLAFKGVGLIIDGVSLAISGVVAGINLAIAAVNLLIKAYNAVNNLFGGKDIGEIPTIILTKGAKGAAVTPEAAKAVKDEIAKEVGDVAKTVAKQTAEITKEAVKASGATASAVVKDELKAGLGGTTGNIGEAMFAIRQMEAGFMPPVVPVGTDIGERMFAIRQREAGLAPAPVINVNVSGAIDQEGTARTIVDTLNNSFYRGTNGARALVT
tara:strand:- start:5350 stop:7119 length:1770 start_codon:yes stop_codon:yes gene_type:complete